MQIHVRLAISSVDPAGAPPEGSAAQSAMLLFQCLLLGTRASCLPRILYRASVDVATFFDHCDATLQGNRQKLAQRIHLVESLKLENCQTEIVIHSLTADFLLSNLILLV